MAEKIIAPTDAVGIVNEALLKSNDIAVVGVAGPGDALASSHALETFKIINEHFPQLIKCMSTNGLLILENYEKILSVGIDSLTVTVNAVNPTILSQLCNYINFNEKVHYGKEAAEILFYLSRKKCSE